MASWCTHMYTSRLKLFAEGKKPIQNFSFLFFSPKLFTSYNSTHCTTWVMQSLFIPSPTQLNYTKKKSDKCPNILKSFRMVRVCFEQLNNNLRRVWKKKVVTVWIWFIIIFSQKISSQLNLPQQNQSSDYKVSSHTPLLYQNGSWSGARARFYLVLGHANWNLSWTGCDSWETNSDIILCCSPDYNQCVKTNIARLGVYAGSNPYILLFTVPRMILAYWQVRLGQVKHSFVHSKLAQNIKVGKRSEI